MRKMWKPQFEMRGDWLNFKLFSRLRSKGFLFLASRVTCYFSLYPCFHHRNFPQGLAAFGGPQYVSTALVPARGLVFSFGVGAFITEHWVPTAFYVSHDLKKINKTSAAASQFDFCWLCFNTSTFIHRLKQVAKSKINHSCENKLFWI